MRRSASMFIGPRTYSEANATAPEDPLPVRSTNARVIRSWRARLSAPSVFCTCMYAAYTDTPVVAVGWSAQLPHTAPTAERSEQHTPALRDSFPFSRAGLSATCMFCTCMYAADTVTPVVPVSWSGQLPHAETTGV